MSSENPGLMGAINKEKRAAVVSNKPENVQRPHYFRIKFHRTLVQQGHTYIVGTIQAWLGIREFCHSPPSGGDVNIRFSQERAQHIAQCGYLKCFGD